MKKLLLFAVLAMVLIGCTAQKGEKTMKQRHLVEAVYSYGGGEYGDHEEVRMEIINDEEVLVTYTSKKNHSAKEKTKKKTLPREAIEKLEDYLEKTGFCLIPQKDYESLEVLDGSTGWYYVLYSDEDSFSFSSTLMTDDKDSETCKVFRSYLYELIETGKIPELP